MDNPTVIQDFINYLKFEKHFSAHTAKCYETDLEQYCGFLAAQTNTSETGNDNTNPWAADGSATATQTQTRADVNVETLLLEADVNTLRRFMADLNTHSYSKSTTARKLATVRSFYKFLVKRNYVTSNPAMTIKTPKQDKKLPKFLEYEQVQRLLNTPPVKYMAGRPRPRDDGGALQYRNAGQRTGCAEYRRR